MTIYYSIGDKDDAIPLTKTTDPWYNEDEVTHFHVDDEEDYANTQADKRQRQLSVFFNTMYLIIFVLLVSVIAKMLKREPIIQRLKNKINKKIKK